MGQGGSDGPAEKLESLHVSQIPDILVAGESQGNDRGIDDSVDFFIKILEPEYNEQKGKKLEEFFNDPCNTDTVEKK